MKKMLMTLPVLLILFTLNVAGSEKESMADLTSRVMDVAVKQSISMAEYLLNSPDRLPRTWNPETDVIVTSNSRWWCSGFYPGTLWYLYELSGNDQLKKYAENYTTRVEREKYTTNNHDVGFMLYCSFGNGLRLTRNAAYREVLTTGSHSLATRFRNSTGLIRSWDHHRDKWDYPVIIDNMMNLELLLWTAKETGDANLYNIAVSHADKTLKHHFRSDFSSWHVVSYDTITGNPQTKQTHQGYADESAWARGQAWGLYGFTMMYRETGLKRYLDHAVNVANFIISHPNMPDDFIPYWDFNAPDIPNALRDASAGAIIASALVELSTFTSPNLSEKYLAVAEKQIRALSSPEYLAEPGTNGFFILKRSVGHLVRNSEVDVPLTYADYYFIEALTRYIKLLNRSQNQIFNQDGAWCWFSDPRAVYHKGRHERTYVGSVNTRGDILMGYFDHKTGEIMEHTVFPELQRDDHINPSILILPDGRIQIYFTRHNGGYFFTRTLRPEDISQWEPVTRLDFGSRLCYTNPAMLSDEKNRIYVFLRGGYDWKPNVTWSDDLGKTWTEPKTFTGFPGAIVHNRPYAKVVNDGKGKIWFAITDGHPRDEPLNSIYVFYYEKGEFFQVDGTLMASMNEIPFDQNLIRKAYDGTETKIRSWIWDLAVDDDGFPRIAYTRLKEETRHEYYYAAWDGNKWNHHLVANAGQDFPREDRKKEDHNREPHYSGGIVLDPANKGVVYYSKPVNDRYEIIRGDFGGQVWRETAITSGSEYDNVRPFVSRNINKDHVPVLFWMSNRMYRFYQDYDTFLQMKVNP
jgi:unsaturated chondroitin disaccharide hydrolase